MSKPVAFFLAILITFSAVNRVSASDEVAAIAKQALNIAQPNSFKNNIEYCGLIGYHLSGALLFSPPIPGFRNSCNPGLNPGWSDLACIC